MNALPACLLPTMAPATGQSSATPAGSSLSGGEGESTLSFGSLLDATLLAAAVVPLMPTPVPAAGEGSATTNRPEPALASASAGTAAVPLPLPAWGIPVEMDASVTSTSPARSTLPSAVVDSLPALPTSTNALPATLPVPEAPATPPAASLPDEPAAGTSVSIQPRPAESVAAAIAPVPATPANPEHDLAHVGPPSVPMQTTPPSVPATPTAPPALSHPDQPVSLPRTEGAESMIGQGRSEWMSLTGEFQRLASATVPPAPAVPDVRPRPVHGEENVVTDNSPQPPVAVPVRPQDDPSPVRETVTARQPTVRSPAAVHEQIADGIITHARLVERGKSSEFIMDLRPPELGSIRVHLSSSPDGVSARLYVADEAVRQLIESQLNELRQRLSQSVGHVAQCTLADTGGQSRHPGQQQGRSFSSRQGYNDPGEPAAVPLVGEVLHSDRLDIVA